MYELLCHAVSVHVLQTLLMGLAGLILRMNRKRAKEWLVQFFGIDFIYFALLTEF